MRPVKNLKHSTVNAYAFTEHGVTMLSSVLNSNRAIEINVQVIRAFIQLRQFAMEHKNIEKRFQEIEDFLVKLYETNEADKQKIYEALDLLMERTKPRKIGFDTKN